jgi:hypothetical protein
MRNTGQEMTAMTTKRSLILGGAALALGAVSWPAVQAWATDQSINLSANVAKFCKFDSLPTFTGLNNISVVSNSIGTSVLNVTSATSATGVLNSGAFNFNVSSTCNSPSKVVLTSQNGGLKDATPTPVSSGSFVNRIDYSAIAIWGLVSAGALVTTGTAGQSAQTGTTTSASTGNLQVAFSLLTLSTNPVLAGDYSDTLRVSLEPQ